MTLYGFMQDKKWYEDVGHILIGLIPMWGWIREHRQWPPGDTVLLYDYYGIWKVAILWDEEGLTTLFAPHDRVKDAYRDFLGYAIGGTIRCIALVGVILRLWVLG